MLSEAAEIVRFEMTDMLDDHGIANGSFLAVTPRQMRRWTKLLAFGLAQPPGTFAATSGEIDRLRTVEVAAREYAESRREWEAALPIASDSEMPIERWNAIQARQDAARANLLALFDVPSLTGDGEGDRG